MWRERFGRMAGYSRFLPVRLKDWIFLIEVGSCKVPMCFLRICHGRKEFSTSVARLICIQLILKFLLWGLLRILLILCWVP